MNELRQTAEERSRASESSGASVPLLVCGAGLLRAGIYDERVFGCFGYHGSAGSLPEQTRYGIATSRDLG